MGIYLIQPGMGCGLACDLGATDCAFKIVLDLPVESNNYPYFLFMLVIHIFKGVSIVNSIDYGIIKF
jgi:hypothetical protein